MAFDSTSSGESEHEEPTLAERVRVQNLIWSLIGVVVIGAAVLAFKPLILSAMLWFWNLF